MWTELFKAIGEGFRFLTNWTRKSNQEPENETDATKARAGAESGAAATHAGRIAGKKP